MRILLLCTVYPPDILGGAEVAASHLAKWLASKGHDVGVLCTAGSVAEASWGDEVDGVRIYRALMPRPYPVLKAAKAAPWLKPIWHLQDHLDIRNECLLRKVLDEFQPDIVNVHLAQGLGHNMMSQLARSNVATVYTLHDLGLACIKASMFRNGRNCGRQEIGCAIASKLKWHWLDKIERFAFWSPSRALADKLQSFVPIETKRLAIIPYPLNYRRAVSHPLRGSRTRLLYVGRLHQTKGVDFLLDVLAPLAAEQTFDFEIHVAGTGPLESELRSKYGMAEWCTFLGFVDQARIGEVIASSDLLCVPSLWAENSPLVIYQAIASGVPIVASRIGGIPELVQHELTGVLCTPGAGDDWKSAFSQVLRESDKLNRLRRSTMSTAGLFDQDVLGAKVVELFQETLTQKPNSHL